LLSHAFETAKITVFYPVENAFPIFKVSRSLCKGAHGFTSQWS